LQVCDRLPHQAVQTIEAYPLALLGLPLEGCCRNRRIHYQVQSWFPGRARFVYQHELVSISVKIQKWQVQMSRQRCRAASQCGVTPEVNSLHRRMRSLLSSCLL